MFPHVHQDTSPLFCFLVFTSYRRKELYIIKVYNSFLNIHRIHQVQICARKREDFLLTQFTTQLSLSGFRSELNFKLTGRETSLQCNESHDRGMFQPCGSYQSGLVILDINNKDQSGLILLSDSLFVSRSDPSRSTPAGTFSLV